MSSSFGMSHLFLKECNMDDLIMCLIIFVIVFLVRFGAYYFSKKKKKSKGIMMEMQYLINRFKLNKKLINTYRMAVILSLVDALIMALVLFLSVRITDNMIVQMLLGFILVIGFIILFNEIIGKILKKKGYDKNEL